jgi:hypothetical protein
MGVVRHDPDIHTARHRVVECGARRTITDLNLVGRKCGHHLCAARDMNRLHVEPLSREVAPVKRELEVRLIRPPLNSYPHGYSRWRAGRRHRTRRGGFGGDLTR